jgi:hypothetical protein
MYKEKIWLPQEILIKVIHLTVCHHYNMKDII